MQIIKLSLILFIAAFTSMQAQTKVKIKGMITDGVNPIGYASVYISNSTDGCISNDKGEFSFLSKKKGKVTLVATMIGYEKFSTEMVIDDRKEIEQNIVLAEVDVKLDGVVVTASAYGTAKEKGVVLDSRDVYTTPGGAADLFQSLKTLPGVTPVSESAQLYVRGGDPIETITMIDQATMYHPYTFESAYGGLFSSLNTATIKGIYFSSGGFSAKYGNALSGVLDVETVDNPDQTLFNVGLSMANASVEIRMPVTDNFGFRLSARQTFTKPIFLLNGGGEDLTITPVSADISTIAVYKYSQTGKIKISAFISHDKQGVNIEQPGYYSEFNGNSTNSFIALQNVDIIGSKLISKTSISFNEYSNTWKLGILDLDQKDTNLKLRNDLEITLSKALRLSGGFEVENRVSHYIGVIPAEDYDMRPNAGGKVLDATLKGSRIGVFTEMEILNFAGIKNATASLGIRGDYIPELKLNWFDPRVSLGYKIDEFTSVALGLGIFGQLPNPRLFSPLDGNPNLKPMKAEHIILSFNKKIGDVEEVRIEAYYKNYKDLPLEHTTLNYDNSGYGYAKGIDIIFKSSNFFGIDGWFSYGIMDSKRKWMDYEEFTNSDYNITHNASIVALYSLTDSWQVGLSCKFATGRPYTPVVSSIFHIDQNVYEPVYGSKNSATYQMYKRVDLRVMYLFQLFGKFGVCFVEGLNILNFNNLFGYSYSLDYSSKKEIASYFGRRMLVFGVNVSF